MRSISRNLLFVATTLTALVIGLSAVSAFGQETSKEKNKEKTTTVSMSRGRGFCDNNWSGGDNISVTELREMTAAASGSLVVDGRQNGGIGIKGEDRSDVLIRACVQAWGPTEEAAKALAGGIKIETGGTIKADGAAGDNHWSVSYQISVPRSMNLNLTAHNGGISISGVDGNVEFETQNGGVTISELSGSVKGRTTNGGVNVRLSGTSWKGSGLDVVTTNGGVNLSIPENFAAHVETGTVNGGFSSDIPALNVETGDGMGKQRSSRISTDLNGGGAPVRVITTNGGIRISSGQEKE